MTEIDHILCPIDFSETSEAALQYAVGLAGKLGAKITVAHVYQVPVYWVPHGELGPGPDVAKAIRDGQQRELGVWVSRQQESTSVELAAKLGDGTPHEVINELAVEMGANLIVMGTHGRTGLSHVFMGSVAERVLRTSRIPVLTIPGVKGGKKAG